MTVRSDRAVVLMPVHECPSNQIAFHLGEALLAGKEVQLAIIGPVSSELLMLVRAYECIYPGRVGVTSTIARGWSTHANRDDVVIVTAHDAYYSERPWLRLASDRESSVEQLNEFYPSEGPGFRVA